MPIKKIPSSEIQIGMYISRLDRPWIETPFMFQGFEVQSEQEIEDLHKLTQHVYIIIADELIEMEGEDNAEVESGDAASVMNKKTYETTVPMDEEVKNIRSLHENVTALFDEIKSLIETGGTLRLESFERPVKSMVSSVVRNPDAYLWLTRLKKFDSYLYKDSLTTSVLGTALGRQMGLTEESLQTLATGCMLMDIGKLSLPSELLHKSERLDHAEWELMKSHVERGVELMDACHKCNPAIREIVLSHHERIDGCGYPNGLQGNQISLFAQIAGIVDQYVAVTNPRPYTTPISPSRAEEMLYKQRGKQFDEIVVEYFIRTLCTYPTGSLVELSTGEVAIVKAQKTGLQLKPDVILLLDPNKQPYGTYTVIGLDNYRQDDLPVTIHKTLADGEFGLEIEELAI